jgi:hypothetical protein
MFGRACGTPPSLFARQTKKHNLLLLKKHEETMVKISPCLQIYNSSERPKKKNRTENVKQIPSIFFLTRIQRREKTHALVTHGALHEKTLRENMIENVSKKNGGKIVRRSSHSS